MDRHPIECSECEGSGEQGRMVDVDVEETWPCESCIDGMVECSGEDCDVCEDHAREVNGDLESACLACFMREKNEHAWFCTKGPQRRWQ